MSAIRTEGSRSSRGYVLTKRGADIWEAARRATGQSVSHIANSCDEISVSTFWRIRKAAAVDEASIEAYFRLLGIAARSAVHFIRAGDDGANLDIHESQAFSSLGFIFDVTRGELEALFGKEKGQRVWETLLMARAIGEDFLLRDFVQIFGDHRAPDFGPLCELGVVQPNSGRLRAVSSEKQKALACDRQVVEYEDTVDRFYFELFSIGLHSCDQAAFSEDALSRFPNLVFAAHRQSAPNRASSVILQCLPLVIESVHCLAWLKGLDPQPCLNSLLRICTRSGKPELRALCLKYRGVASWVAGELVSARLDLTTAERLFDLLAMIPEQVDCLRCVGMLDHVLGDDSSAAISFNRAFALAASLREKGSLPPNWSYLEGLLIRDHVSFKCNRGEPYHGEVEKVLDFLLLAGNDLDRAYTMQIVADQRVSTGQVGEAVMLFDDCLQLLRRNCHWVRVCEVLNSKCDLLLASCFVGASESKHAARRRFLIVATELADASRKTDHAKSQFFGALAKARAVALSGGPAASAALYMKAKELAFECRADSDAEFVQDEWRVVTLLTEGHGSISLGLGREVTIQELSNVIAPLKPWHLVVNSAIRG